MFLSVDCIGCGSSSIEVTVSLDSGTQLGPYRIEGPAGAGGMGEVYRARDTRLDRMVAIKVLPAHLADRTELKQRLEREAKTISSLQHPHICALFDVGHESGVDFLVMEYLEGRTLADRLREGPLPTDELLTLGIQMTEALDAAHRRGIVHRDLKPGNIMLTRTGVKLLDFGLAKAVQAADPASSITSLPTAAQSSDPLTAQGTVLGTFQYMAPEQLEGGEADARSDIFALGAVLYEAATGRRAFEGKSQAGLIASIMAAEPPAISTSQPTTPPALDRVIGTCLNKDPEKRWQTAHDVALQLRWIQEGGSEVGIPRPVAARRRNRERLAWVLAAVLGAAAVGQLVITMLRPAPPAPGSMRFDIEAPKGLVSLGSPRISPSGKFIAFQGRDTTGAVMLWVRPLNALAAYPLPGTENTGRPFWSADSRSIGFFAGGKLKRVPVTGGPPVSLCDFGTGSDGSWGAAGSILFDGRAGDSIQVVPEGGGTPQGLVRIDRSRNETSNGWPHFLPDGKHFVYIVFRTGAPDEIWLGMLGSTKSTFLTEGNSRVEYVEPGYLIFERAGTLLAQRFDVHAGKLSGDPFPLAEGIGTGDVGLAHFSGSQTGTLIYTGGETGDRQLDWVDRQGHLIERVGEAGRYYDPALSPDGRRLAVEIVDSRQDASDLWVFDLKRHVPTRLTFDRSYDYCPLWSPDGTRIAFASDRDPKGGLFIKNASGTGSDTEFVTSKGRLIAADWSRDGKTLIAHIRRPNSSWDVVSIDVAGDMSIQDQVATPVIDANGRLSPDGKFMAYQSNESGRMEVYIVTFPAGGGKWQVSIEGGFEPYWRNDGREIVYMALDRQIMTADVSYGDGVEVGIPKRLFQSTASGTTNDRNHYVPTPDLQKFLIASRKDGERVPPITVVLNWASELKNR
jgi:eukaryotic-like serine/threonine-protein kinase